MKILILSCSTGGGHNSCAMHIANELKANNIECTFKDFFDIVNNSAKDLSSKLYLNSLKKNGKIFEGVYKAGELVRKSKIKSPVYLANKLHKNTLFKYLEDNHFDLVITTHIFPALTLTAINKPVKKIKFILVATDYECCPFMEETKPDYLVIQKGTEEKFISRGINKDILVPTGIPVSTTFVDSAKNIKTELNIKDEKVLLIMLGSMGFGNITNILKELLNINNLKIIVVCGTNKDLYQKLTSFNNPNLIPLGFVNNINDLIYTSDIVISKPGGLSSTEIATIRKPLIHAYGIPGIETHNIAFYSRHGLSLNSKKEEDIIQNVTKLLEDQDLCNEILTHQKETINRNSAKDLVDLIKEIKL